jgi:hypothetical protein
MPRLGLYNNGNKCWLNSLVQFFCSIPEISQFLTEYKGTNDIIIKLKELNDIIYNKANNNYNRLSNDDKKDKQKEIKDYIIKNIKDSQNESTNYDCDRQQDATEFFYLLYNNENYLKNILDELFKINRKGITLFNQIINPNKNCKTYSKQNDSTVNYTIKYYDIEENDNIIDKIYLEYIFNDDDIDCNDSVEKGKEIKLKATKLRIDYKPIESKYIYINYYTYNNLGFNDFKSINFYKRFSFNNNYYIIKGIIIHSGGDTINYGHFYYLEYDNKTDKWTEYNDNNVNDYHKIEMHSNNIIHFNDKYNKPIFIIYEKVTNIINHQDFKQINFDFDNYVKIIQQKLNNQPQSQIEEQIKRQEEVDYIHNIIINLPQEQKLQKINEKQALEKIQQDFQKELLQQLLQQSPQQLPQQPQQQQIQNQMEEDLRLAQLQQQLRQQLLQQQLLQQGPRIKPIDELSKSINSYFSLFQKKA